MFDEGPPPQNALMQDPAFAQALRLCGQSPAELPCGLTILQRRIFGLPMAMLPRAAVPPDLPDQLRLAGLHRTLLILSPDTPCPMQRALRLRRPQTLAVIDLTQPEKLRRSGLHQKWRNQLRRAEEHHLTVTRGPLPADPDTDVLRIETRQARTRGYANWPAPLTAAFAAAAPRQTHLFRTTHEGRQIAHMLFLSHGAHVSYHIGHTTAEGRGLHAHNLLLWRAAQHFAKAGFTALNLGLLDPRTPSLNRFKRRAGAKPQQTGGTYLYWQPFTRR